MVCFEKTFDVRRRTGGDSRSLRTGNVDNISSVEVAKRRRDTWFVRKSLEHSRSSRSQVSNSQPNPLRVDSSSIGKSKLSLNFGKMSNRTQDWPEASDALNRSSKPKSHFGVYASRGSTSEKQSLAKKETSQRCEKDSLQSVCIYKGATLSSLAKCDRDDIRKSGFPNGRETRSAFDNRFPAGKSKLSLAPCQRQICFTIPDLKDSSANMGELSQSNLSEIDRISQNLAKWPELASKRASHQCANSRLESSPSTCSV